MNLKETTRTRNIVLELIVMSKYQYLLDAFLRDLMPQLNKRVILHILSKGLDSPSADNIKQHYMGHFLPNKYFNSIAEELNPKTTHVGILNDDLLFSSTCIDQVLTMMNDYDFFSPGFVESPYVSALTISSEKTANNTDVFSGLFDAFYVFSVDAMANVGEFDEQVVEWYDLDWLIRMANAGYSPVTSTKVTVLHSQAATLKDKASYKRKVKEEILQKHGNKGLKIARRIPVGTRKEMLNYV